MIMKKVNVYVDWFNLYHALKHKIKDPNSQWTAKYKRCDLRKLAQQFLKEDEKLNKVYFFTAYAERDQGAKKRHEIYNHALRKTGTDVILWKFNQVTKQFIKDKNWLIHIEFSKGEVLKTSNQIIPQKIVFTTFEEKETDVNIALKILEDAFFDNYDTAIVISWDSDIIPSIATVRRLSKKWKISPKNFTSLLVPWTKAKMMKKACNEIIEITTENMENSLLPEEIEIEPWKVVKKPESWK